MTEPTSATAAVAAGLGAGLLASLSLEPGPLFWAVIGASLGMTAAPASTPRRAWIVFACVVLVSSVLGAHTAQRWADGAQLTRNAFSCVWAMFFHPIFNAVAAQIPALLTGARRKWFGSEGDTP